MSNAIRKALPVRPRTALGAPPLPPEPTVYFVKDPAVFQTLGIPLGPNGLVFWSQGTAGGVLLMLNIHYSVSGNLLTASNVPLSVGDRIITV